MRGKARRVVLALTLVVTTVLMLAAPAGAVAIPIPRDLVGKSGTNTDMIMSGTGPGRGVPGFVPLSSNPFDPVLNGYPPSNPTTGFVTKNEGFAGVIFGRPTNGGATLSLYCFDLFTDTWNGIGYGLGTWDAATVPNVGYVARILSENYPFVPSQPAGLANTTEQAAAVQAAIWFFSDRYVLNTSDPLHDTVAAIVAHIISQGPLPAPTPPSLTISPTNLSGPTGSIVGPFTVTSTAGVAKVSATGALMFSNAAATSPILDGTPVPSGTQIWLRSTGPTAAVLQATADAHVPRQNVYLYDGNTPGVNDAQRLILALDSTLTTTVSATAQFKAVGSLTVQKTISGPAAGRQGQVTIHTVCGGTALTPDLVVASGTPAGTSSRTYNAIPSGTVCTITETANGTEQTTNITVNTTGQGGQVTIPENSTATATITDDYDFVPGSLTVIKNITGAGAGLQGDVTVHVDCGGGLTRDFTIPAGTAAGSTPESVNGIPANSVCTITEPADGSNSAVSVNVTGGGTVTIPSGSSQQIALTDEYTPNPGSLVVTKTIAGDAAGAQGPVTISVECDGTPLTPDFTIPAGAPAGSASSPPYTDIPAGSVCSATETVDGHTSTTAAEVTGDSGTPITISPGGTSTATINDTYTDISGQLVVNKTITGNGAGQQGPITIHVECPTGTPQPDFTIAAGESSASHTYTGLAPGVQCTLTETETGSVAGVVDVTPTIVQPPPIISGGSVESTVTDEVAALTGSLTVTKSIEGTAAGQQGQVTIGVQCVGVPLSQTPPFIITAGTTGSPSQTYTGIPNGTTCQVFEIADGRTSTVSVTVDGRFQTATVAAGSTASATITDTYTEIPGTIIVPKLLSGPAAGQQGDITITATCDGTALPDIVIPAGTPAGLQTPSFSNIPAGATCIVTETADGTTATVTANVLPSGEQTVTVPAATTVAVPFVDIYHATPGNLLVVKQISGAGAGQQGQIELLVDCGQPLNQYAITIPAGAPAGTVSRSFPNIPAGLICTVTETADGSSDSVPVIVTGSGQKVTIPPAGTVTVPLDNHVLTSITPPDGGNVVPPGVPGAPEAPIGEITVPVTG